MKPKDEYAYFQPGEIVFFISHERDQLINPAAKRGGAPRLINAELNGPENNLPIGPEASGPESDQSANGETNSSDSDQSLHDDKDNNDDQDDKDYDDNEQDDIKYDQEIDDLVNWSNGVAERSFKRTLVIARVKERELHFPGTLTVKEVKEPSAPEISSPEWKTWDEKKSPILENGGRKGAFSLIPAQVRISENDETWKNSDFEKKQNPDRYVERADLARLVVELDDHRNDDEQPLKKQGITLVAVTPNWLSSPCSELGGGGGPGVPEPFRRKILWILLNFLHSLLPNLFPEPRFVPPPYLFVLPASKAGFQATLREEGKGVTVAILDTAPTQHDMAAAYERHHKVIPKNQKEYQHDTLIEELLGPDSLLEVHHASLDDLLRLRALHLKDHDYEMHDHGLFIAGIIHTLAPKAKIHLYEVLNSQGVGDLLSLAKGLGEVLDRFAGQLLVVNCSLVFNIPRRGHQISDLDKAFLQKIIEDWNTHKDERIDLLTQKLVRSDADDWSRRQAAVIEWLCDQLYFYNSRVIAAAGNSWKRDENEPRPLTSYPAEFESVLGVGALPKDAKPDPTSGKYPVTSYSNISDDPPRNGVTTLGGEPGERNGVLGVYIGQFPDMHYRLQKYPWILRPIMWIIFAIKWGNFIRPRNETDLAWWCGTSFATPIIAGWAAAVLSGLPNGARTQDAILNMYSTTGISQGLTDLEEDGVEGIEQQ